MIPPLSVLFTPTMIPGRWASAEAPPRGNRTSNDERRGPSSPSSSLHRARQYGMHSNTSRLAWALRVRSCTSFSSRPGRLPEVGRVQAEIGDHPRLDAVALPSGPKTGRRSMTTPHPPLDRSCYTWPAQANSAQSALRRCVRGRALVRSGRGRRPIPGPRRRPRTGRLCRHCGCRTSCPRGADRVARGTRHVQRDQLDGNDDGGGGPARSTPTRRARPPTRGPGWCHWPALVEVGAGRAIPGGAETPLV